MSLWRPVFFILLGFLVYGSFLNNPFIMDDEIQIVGNRHVQSLEYFPTYFTSSTMGTDGSEKMGGIYYKPLMSTYFALAWLAGGGETLPFRVPMLLMHCLSAFFLFCIFSLFFSARLSFGLATLFLLHPANSEVLFYIADVQDVMYMFFGLAAWLLAIRLEKKWQIFIGTLILFIMSLLSKETGLLMILTVLGWSWFFAKPKLKPLLASSGILLLVYTAVRFSIGLTSAHNDQLLFNHASWFERARMFPLVLGHFLEIFIFPWRLSLATDFVLKDWSLEDFWLPLLGCLAFAALIFWIYKKTTEKKVFYLFALIFLMWLGLHTHLLVPLDGVYADRWIYLGTVALIGFIGLALKRLETKIPAKILTGIFIVLMGAFVTRIYVRGQDWKSPYDLYFRELSLHPWDPVMNNNVGVELFRAGQIKESQPYFKTAVDLNPYWPVSVNNLGATFQRAGDLQTALAYYEKSSRMGYALAIENKAGMLYNLGRYDECAIYVDNVLKNFPFNPTLLKIKEALKQR